MGMGSSSASFGASQYVCIIYMYITKQVNRLKLVRLQMRTSDLAKLYTIDKFGAESCPMVRKQIHKLHNILWNAYSYLKKAYYGIW